MRIHVRVDPQQTNTAAMAEGMGNAFPRADRARVITADHDRQLAVPDNALYTTRKARADAAYGFERVGAMTRDRSERVAPACAKAARAKPARQLSGAQNGARFTARVERTATRSNADQLNRSQMMGRRRIIHRDLRACANRAVYS
jgi:hypothetical protein